MLSDDWYVLKKTTFDYRRADGRWQTMSRETYDRGNGVTVLPVDAAARTVLLIRQFRYPAYVNGWEGGMLIETCAGIPDGLPAEEAIRKEVAEEIGCRIGEPRKVFELFMSPGSVTERVTFFIAEYDSRETGRWRGGLEEEGEDIEVLEVGFEEAWRMVEEGEIVDGKTVILLQHLRLMDGFPGEV